MAIASTLLISPRPSIVTMRIASNSDGNESRTSIQRIKHVVESPAEEPGDESDDRADHHGENDRSGAGEQRDARPEHDATELVAAVLVEAHHVLDLRLVTAQPVDARSFELDLVGRRIEEDLGGVIGGDQRSEHGHPDDQRGEGETDAPRP